MCRLSLFALLLIGLHLTSAVADEADSNARLASAVERGLAIVTRGAKNYPTHRQCFSCHHQTLPLMGLAEARQAGLAIDQEVFQSQLEFTQAFFTSRRESLASGERIGGAAATVAYGLWTYDIASAPADEVTDALVTNLLKLQQADGHWQPPSIRPPLEESHLSLTVLAAYGLQRFARDSHQQAATAALEKAEQWLAAATPESTEDDAFLLLWYTRYQPDNQRADAAARRLWASQRKDGGWGQTKAMESDAYATGQAVAILSDHLTDDSPDLRRGIDYLLSTQQADGSWHVKSRSKPVQKYFDNGDPHGTDQFISMAATSWATTALLRSERLRRDKRP